MEHQPNNPHDRDRDVPDREQLWPGEVDLTGAVEQDDVLADVIGDAIREAVHDSTEVPEWGARTLARALADEQADRISGGLHHFAVTGRVNKEALSRELSELYQTTDRSDIREWVNWLGSYVRALPRDPKTEAYLTANSEERTPAEYPTDGSRLDQVGYYLSHEYPFNETTLEKVRDSLFDLFRQADTTGEPIALDDARALATLLARLLPPSSEMHRFATTGEANPIVFHEECEFVRQRNWRVYDITTWVRHLKQHLAARPDLGRQPGETVMSDPGADPENPQITQGLRGYGDAFRAYLQLPRVDPQRNDLIDGFRALYRTSFASIDGLIARLSQLQERMPEMGNFVDDGAMQSFRTLDRAGLEALAHDTWDIVEVGGRLHLFSKGVER